MISSLLYDFNHAPVWQREVRIWDYSVRATSLDRLLFLALHRAKLMGGEALRYLPRLVDPGMQVVDVGANLGLYTLLLAHLTGEEGHVFAFEPEPNLFAVLKKNCAENNAVNVTAFQCAAGESKGRTSFRRAIFNSGNNSLSIGGTDALSVETEVVRLDEVLPVQAVQFIKLDVQGHELAALNGMQRLLASTADLRVLCEFWPAGLRKAGATPELLFQFFRDRDFLVYELEERPRPLNSAASLVSKLRGNRYTNILASRRPL